MLEFKHIDVSVNKTPILSDISIAFDEGKITTIIGPNGCGKTTLLQTLNALSTVTAGEIILDDENYIELSYKERAKRLSFMSQFRESAPMISVGGLVEHGRFPYMGFSRKMSMEDRVAVSNALDYTGVSEYKNHMVNELSGGVQQRVYLAMQLAQNSRYMVMDEPMNYLDFPAQRKMYKLIKNLVNEGKSIILVLHDLNHALQISDTLVVMQNRKIIGVGTPKECMESGILEKVFDCEVNEVTINGTTQYVFI